MIRDIARKVLRKIRMISRYLKLPSTAKAEHRKDLLGLPEHDPGIDKAINEGVNWLCRAQSNSASQDQGVARHFSLLNGWGESYPETTGYIVPTLIDYAKLTGDVFVRERARRMLDWLVAIQFPGGGFKGGTINSTPEVPVTFNTGQILLGLASGVQEFGEKYYDPMCRAADWLVKTQDPDGCWRKFPTPFAEAGEKSYETHVAWGLLEAARLAPDKPYAEAALANVRWALKSQKKNGWFGKCCLEDPIRPLTHTIGYALRGVLEAYRFTKDIFFLEAGCRTAEGLLKAIKRDGFLSGRLHQDWQGAVTWSCLTGSVQIAYCWLMLFEYTNDVRYREAAFKANSYVRRTMKVNGSLETLGAIKGSYPLYGGYLPYEYPNWACKFFIDSNMLERSTKNKESVLSSFPFLKIFSDKNADDSVVIHLRNNDILPESVLPCSVDYLVVDNLNYNIDELSKVLKPDGKLILFGENRLSYLNIRKNSFTICRKSGVNFRLLEKNNFKYRLDFSLDGEFQRVFWGKQISRMFVPPLISGKKKLKTWLLKNKFFQPFMPYRGIVISKRPIHNYLYNNLLQEIELFSSDTALFWSEPLRLHKN